MRMSNELAGQVALVTGGGRGFGKAIAKAFAAAGAAVTVTARSTKQLDATVAEIKAAGGKALAVPGDVTHRKDVERVVAAVHRHFGATTLLVNNAGLASPFGPIGTIDPDEWWASQAVHVFGPFLLHQPRAAGHDRETRRAHHQRGEPRRHARGAEPLGVLHRQG